MSLIGFARVSTQQQDLSSQIKKLEDAGCKKIFKGKHSGKADSNKEALAELLAYVRQGDTVVVTKMDRFGRSLSQVLMALETLKAQGVTLICTDQPVDTSQDDPMSNAMTQLLGLFAEMERNFIITRTQEGKAQSGNYGGRPTKLSNEQRLEVRAKLKKGISKIALSKEYNVSRATILNIEKSEDGS